VEYVLKRIGDLAQQRLCQAFSSAQGNAHNVAMAPSGLVSQREDATLRSSR
jgi:hypothetical protein